MILLTDQWSLDIPESMFLAIVQCIVTEIPEYGDEPSFGQMVSRFNKVARRNGLSNQMVYMVAQYCSYKELPIR